MKKLFVLGWLLVLAGMAVAQCPIKSASEKIVKPLICLDTLGRNATPDSAHITTYKDDATFATYFARSTTYPFTAASIDTTRPAIGGTAPVLYWLSETISNIDGTASNATLAINVQLWWKGYSTDNMYCVQMVPDSLSDVIWKLAALTAAPLEPTTAGRKLDVSTGGEAGIDWANVGSPTTAVYLSGTDIKRADSVRNVMNIASTDTLTTILGNVNGSVATATNLTNAPANGDLTATMKTSVENAVWDAQKASHTTATSFGVGVYLDTANAAHVGISGPELMTLAGTQIWSTSTPRQLTGAFADTVTTKVWAAGTRALTDKVGFGLSATAVDDIWNEDSTGHYTSPHMAFVASQTGSSTGLDSATTSRIIKRTVWGVASGTGSDSTSKSQRVIGGSIVGDSVNTFTYSTDLVDLIWDEDSTGHYTSPNMAFTSAQTGSSTGLDSATTSRIIRRTVWGMPLGTGSDSTAIAERKVGTVVTANTATNLTNAPTNGDLTATMKSSIGTQVWTTSTPRQLTGNFADTTAAKVWATGTKAITAVGTGGIVAGSFGAGAIDAAAIATNALHFGTEIDTVGNEQGVKTEATSGGGGATAADIWSYGTRTLTSGSVSANLYPFLERITTVDAGGTIPKYQFVIDTTELGGSNEYAMINRAISIRDTNTNSGKTIVSAIIERVNCVAANCTLQVADSLPFAPGQGDSVWFWGDRPAYVMATLSEASAQFTDSLLDRDTTGNSAAGSVGGAIASGGTTAAAFDSTIFLYVLQSHQWYEALDSLTIRMRNSNGDGLPTNAQLITIPDLENSVLPVDVVQTKGNTTLAIDTVLTATAVNLGSDSVYTKGGIVDTVLTQVASGGDCFGDGLADACTLYVFHGATPIENVYVRVNNTGETAKMASGFTDANGRIIFNLNASVTYKVRVQRANVNQITNPQSVTVGTNGANDTILINTTPQANEAVIIGNIDCENCPVRFALESNGQPVTDTSTNRIITRRVIDVKTDEDGFLTVSLPKTGNMLYQSGIKREQPKWKVTSSRTNVLREPNPSFLFSIPSDSSQIDIGELMN